MTNDTTSTWDPGDFYALVLAEIKEMARKGVDAHGILAELGTGDDYNGRVDEDEALDWLEDYLEQLRDASIDDLEEADEADELWEAAKRACELHRVDIESTTAYWLAADRARHAGLTHLANALDKAEAKDRRFEKEAPLAD